MNLTELKKQTQKLIALEDSVVEGIFEIIDLKTNSNMEMVLLKLEEKFGLVDKQFEQMDKKFEHMDKQFEQMDKKFDHIESRMELKIDMTRLEMKSEIAEVKTEIQVSLNKNISWTIGILFSLFALALALLKIH
jgi:tetrahydromethanopterin S-methyltransferase subunit G